MSQQTHEATSAEAGAKPMSIRWPVPTLPRLRRLRSSLGQSRGVSATPGLRTVVFNGVDDVMIPTIDSYILAERLPDARLVRYSDSGDGELFRYPHHFGAEVKLFLADAPH
jgi:hypothetical protein